MEIKDFREKCYETGMNAWLMAMQLSVYSYLPEILRYIR
jgi:hypothetical protein